MPMFRKLPVEVEVEARRYEPASESCVSLHEWLGYEHDDQDCFEDAELYISTLEGMMRADPGDWIIEGVNGEFYPCKPDIFEKTYEAVGSAPTQENRSSEEDA